MLWWTWVLNENNRSVDLLKKGKQKRGSSVISSEFKTTPGCCLADNALLVDNIKFFVMFCVVTWLHGLIWFYISCQRHVSGLSRKWCASVIFMLMKLPVDAWKVSTMYCSSSFTNERNDAPNIYKCVNPCFVLYFQRSPQYLFVVVGEK